MLPNVYDYMILQHMKFDLRALTSLNASLLLDSELAELSFLKFRGGTTFFQLALTTGGYVADPTIVELVAHANKQELQYQIRHEKDPMKQEFWRVMAPNMGIIKQDIRGKPWVHQIEGESEMATVVCKCVGNDFQVRYNHSLDSKRKLCAELWPIEGYVVQGVYPFNLFTVNYYQKAADVVEKCQHLIRYVENNLLDKKK